MGQPGTAEMHREEGTTVRDIRSAQGPPAGDPRPDGPRGCTSLFERLRERKIVQWTVAYLAIAWVVLQLMDILAEIWSWSVLFQQVVSLVLAFGILPMLVLAWFHGEKGRQEICSLEAALMAATIMGAAFAVWSISMELVAC